MPKIFEYLAYIIRFYTNDHLPIHVHVQIQDRETKVEFYFDEKNELILVFKKVKGIAALTKSEANEIAIFLKMYHLKIIEKWNKVFIYHQKVDCEKIANKIKKKN